jgi:hypothetical protein
MQTELSEGERRYECSVGSYLNPNADLSYESLAAEKGRIVYCPYFSKRFIPKCSPRRLWYWAIKYFQSVAAMV